MLQNPQDLASNVEAQGSESGDSLPSSLKAKIATEVSNAARVVKELEGDAINKGLALKLSGVRYKIYQTITD